MNKAVEFLKNHLAIKYSLYAVIAALAFGIITNVLPQKISQKDPLYGYGSDSSVYWDTAGNLISGRGFVNSPGFDFAYLETTKIYTYTTQRLPGYPLALAVVRVITPSATPNGAAVLVFNLILVFLNAYFIISLLQNFFPLLPAKYFWAVVLFPPFLIYSNSINSDFFTAVLLSGFCYFIVCKENKMRWWAVLFAAWALLSRGNALFFLLPFCSLFILTNLKQKKNIALGFVTLVLLAVVFCGWSYRNYKLSGRFVFAPFTGQQLLQNYIDKIYKYNQPQGEERFYKWRDTAYITEHFKQLAAKSNIYSAEAQLNQELIQDTFNLLLQKKLAAIKIYIRNVAQIVTNEYFIFNLARTYHVLWLWVIVWTVVLLLFTIPGSLMLLTTIFFAVKRYNTLFATLIYSATLYVLLTAAILGDFSRYMVPVGFAVILSLAYVYQKLINRYNKV